MVHMLRLASPLGGARKMNNTASAIIYRLQKEEQPCGRVDLDRTAKGHTKARQAYLDSEGNVLFWYFAKGSRKMKQPSQLTKGRKRR